MSNSPNNTTGITEGSAAKTDGLSKLETTVSRLFLVLDSIGEQLPKSVLREAQTLLDDMGRVREGRRQQQAQFNSEIEEAANWVSRFNSSHKQADEARMTERNRGTEQAILKAREKVESFFYARETCTWIYAKDSEWLNQELAIHDAEIAEIKKHPEALANLKYYGLSFWDQFAAYREKLVTSFKDATTASEMADAAIVTAQSVLEKGAAPGILKSVVATAEKAAIFAEKAWDTFNRITQYELGNVTKTALAAIEEFKRNSRSQNSGGPVPNQHHGNTGSRNTSNGSSDSVFNTSPVHEPSYPSYYPEPSYAPYGAVNPASGLPMQGGGSCFDVGGNPFGTSNF